MKLTIIAGLQLTNDVGEEAWHPHSNFLRGTEQSWGLANCWPSDWIGAGAKCEASMA